MSDAGNLKQIIGLTWHRGQGYTTRLEIQRSLFWTPVSAIPWISQIEIRPAYHAVNGTGHRFWELNGGYPCLGSHTVLVSTSMHYLRSTCTAHGIHIRTGQTITDHCTWPRTCTCPSFLIGKKLKKSMSQKLKKSWFFF